MIQIYKMEEFSLKDVIAAKSLMDGSAMENHQNAKKF